MRRGFFGVGIYQVKTTYNIGSLMRTAHSLGADMLFTIGRRYKRQASDTTFASKHVPLFSYETFEDFYKAMPWNTQLIGIEIDETSTSLYTFSHPERAIYLLGAEDIGLPKHIMKAC